MKQGFRRMIRVLEAILLLVLTVVVAASAVTAWSATGERDALEGQALRGHMLASGALVVVLPVVAVWFLRRAVGGRGLSMLGRIGYWTLVAAGWAVIASVYVCMLPVTASDRMAGWIELHAVAGYLLCGGLVALLLGVRWRRPAAAVRSDRR